MRGTHFVSVVLVIGSFVFAVRVARAEIATPEEMERVCQNWLSYLVHEQGGWAGTTTPEIVASREMMAGEMVLGRVYSIAPRGFVLVPVLKELPPIKAYSDEHELDVDGTGGLPRLFRDVLENRFTEYVRRYGSLEAVQPRTRNVMLGPEHRAEWDRYLVEPAEFRTGLARGATASMTQVGPLLTSAWHQHEPYNNSCPMGDGDRTLVGCVATAAAQLMNYHEWPPSGVGEHTYLWYGDYSCDGSTASQFLSADFSDPYNWVQMPDSCGGGCSPTQEAALAELGYEVAVAYEMSFGACASGAYTESAVVVLPRYFRYAPDMVHELRINHTPASWFNLIKADINAGRPLIYGIYSHSIVCDGWQNTGELNQYHMNYGWGGGANAWYTLDAVHCDWGGCDYLREDLVGNIRPMPDADCQPNGTWDYQDIWGGTSLDCNHNAIPDECDIAIAASSDCQGDGIPDECQMLSVVVPPEDGACLATATNGAPWCETFETYPAGSIQGRNGWEGWGGDPMYAGLVNTIKNHTPGGAKSLRNDYQDSVHVFAGYDESVSPYWVLRARAYIPAGMQRTAWFIVLADYDGGGAGTSWAVSLEMNPAEGTIKSHDAWAKLPLVTNQWAEIRLEINFDRDIVTIFYNDDLLGQHPWSAGGGSMAVAAVDLWGNETNGFYFDDLSLIPTVDLDCNRTGVPDECEPGDCDGDGTLAMPDVPDLFDCLTGPCGTPPCGPPLYVDPCCVLADFDHDGDHDLADAAEIQARFGE